MSESETFDYSRVPEEDRTSAAWVVFLSQMRGRRYGAEETLNAWQWFRMKIEERKFVFDLVDMIVGYEKAAAAKRAGEAPPK